MKNKILRNPFVALCEYASLKDWCWKIHCTTCGHGAFKVAFSKIIHDQHPDDDSFWPHGKSNHALLKEVDKYNDFWMRADTINQLKLATTVAAAKISDIQAIAKFPDWLGYIGLVINHCSDYEARKIISDKLIPQFIVMTKDNEELCNYLKKKHSENGILNIDDLGWIEHGKVLDKSPIIKA